MNSTNYIQWIWKPDCQLTAAFDKAKLATAISYLSETILPFNGRVKKIVVIKYNPANQLFSYEIS